MIRWLGTPPPEVERAVDPLLDIVVHRLPPWCRLLFVAWSTTGADVLADVDAAEEHRWATLTLYPKLLDLPEPERLRTVAHEVAHVYLNRLDAAVEDIIDQAVPADRRALARAIYDRASEAVTEDVAGLI